MLNALIAKLGPKTRTTCVRVFVFVCGECLLGWLAAADGATFNSGGGGDGGGGGGVSRIGGHDERERELIQ